MELNGKVAIVTGAGRGIGKEIAIDLAKEGCRVVLVSRTKRQLKMVKDEIKRLGGNAITADMDLCIPENIDKLVDRVVSEFGSVNILINNAAVLFSSDFLNITEDQWDNTMNINLKAPFLLSQRVLGVMKEHKNGYIINVSSTAALEVPEGIAAYGISKLGMVGLSQAMYEFGKKYGIKVSTLYPGMTDTEMLRSFNPPVDKVKWMKPDDISGCVVFLLKQSDRVVVRDIIPWARRYDKI